MPAPLRDVPDEAVELIKAFEGIPDGDPRTVNIDAYIDPVGIWTIGWGHAIAHQGAWLRGAHNEAVARALFPGGITKAQAELLLRGDLVDSARDVARLVKVALSDGQFGALVSFAFNLGAGNLGQSTLLRLLNGGDHAGAAEQFLRWNMGTLNGVKQPLAGLTRRRKAERAMFLGQDWRAAGDVRGAKKRTAKKAAAKNAPRQPSSRARTTTPTAPPPAPPAARRSRQKTR
jgi:lysozyme